MGLFGEAVHDEGVNDDAQAQANKIRDHQLTAPNVKKKDKERARREAAMGDPNEKEHIYQRTQYARNSRLQQ